VKPLRLDEAARSELLHEVRYLEQAREGLGKRFRSAVTDVFARIREHPLHGAPDEASTRRMRVKGFRFAVVYRDEADEVVVYAIRSDQRRPGYWISRVSKP
jgi:plasmid stabilization system protein ParE